MNEVILVDQNDNPIGVEEKITAHKKALLHRAFSVFIFYKTERLELLLQQRQVDKYHCGGLWTNSCCSHPKPGERTIPAGERRLLEELGIQASLKEVGHFIYKAEFENGLTEHEFDHVLVGFVDNKAMMINPEEVSDIAWLTLPEIEEKLKNEPETMTPWFKQAFEIAKAAVRK